MKNLRQTWVKFLNALARRGVSGGILAGLLPALLIVYFGYGLFVTPGVLANQDKQKNIEIIEADVEKGKAVEKSEQAFKTEFTKVVQLFYDSLPLLPKETELSSVMLDVQEAARRHNVTLTGLTAVRDAMKTANADKLYEREIPCAVIGNYDDVMRFFMEISKMTRILIVRDYIVGSAKDAKQTGVRPTSVAVQFSLLAFHAPPTSEFPVLPPGIISPVQTAQSSSMPVQTAQNTVQ